MFFGSETSCRVDHSNITHIYPICWGYPKFTTELMSTAHQLKARLIHCLVSSLKSDNLGHCKRTGRLSSSGFVILCLPISSLFVSPSMGLHLHDVLKWKGKLYMYILKGCTACVCIYIYKHIHFELGGSSSYIIYHHIVMCLQLLNGRNRCPGSRGGCSASDQQVKPFQGWFHKVMHQFVS